MIGPAEFSIAMTGREGVQVDREDEGEADLSRVVNAVKLGSDEAGKTDSGFYPVARLITGFK